jgi:XTP/dITP diphosphohydrolase
VLKLKFVTTNPAKFREVQVALQAVGIQVERLDIIYPEIQAQKLREVIKFALNWVTANLQNVPDLHDDWAILIEDSGLFIQALNNFPGVYSKFVFQTIGYEGVLRLLATVQNRKALFVSCIGYMDVHGENKVFIGKCKGTIAPAPRGKGGFGYDPIFVPEGESRTFGELAELDINEKNKYSHRGKALKQLIDFIKLRY